MEDNFAQFDKNGDGFLELKELKACFYSLGEERTTKDIEAMIAQHGSEKGLTRDQFKEVMISILAVTDSKV